MTMRAFFGPLAAKLNEREFGTKIRTSEGDLRDTGVQELVDVLREAFLSSAPIEINEPILLNNMGGGPALLLNSQGESVKGIEMYDADGRYASFGIGLGNEGIISNQVLVLPWYSIDPLVAHCVYSNGGGQGGVSTQPPPDPREVADGVPTFWTAGGNPGIGLTNVKDCGVGSGYGIEQSGSGYRFDALGGNDTFFFTDSLGGTGGEGGSGGGGAVYGTILSIGDDTVSVQLLTGETVSAAKPYYLRRTTFDGETVSGITYTYSDSQNREADDGSSTVDQRIFPYYAVGDGILLCETPDGNGTGTTYMDVNSDARVWTQVPASC